MKVSIIGAGRVGPATAFALANERVVDEIAIVDVVENLARAEVLDIGQTCLVKTSGGSDFSAISGSDVVVISAGKSRQPGMTRTDLILANKDILSGFVDKIVEFAPSAIVVTLTNPMDVMNYFILKKSGFEPSRVIGQGNFADSLRFQYFSRSPNALVAGEHGDSMVLLWSHAGLKRDESVERRVKQAGAEIIGLKGFTSFGPAFATKEIIKSIVKDEKRVLPVSVFVKELGVSIGVTASIGRKGAEKVFVPKMDEQEQKAFQESVESVKKNVSMLGLEK